MQTCIGLDVGRSSVKAVVSHGKERSEHIFPSAVVAAFAMTDEREASFAQKETVLVGNQPYFFGDTAVRQGGEDLIGGMSDDWFFSDQHSALFLGALQKLKQAGVADVDSALIVVGLPASWYAANKSKLTNFLSQLVPTAEIRVLSQSMGPYHQLMFTTDGRENANYNGDEESWGVIEVGQFTTDYALLIKGHPVEKAFGSCAGMRVAAQDLQNLLLKNDVNVNLAWATEALRTKQVPDFGKELDVTSDVLESIKPLASTIMNKSDQLIGSRARELKGILVAGGGAPLIFNEIKKKWPNTVLSENSRFSVADGFCRFAQALSAYRASQGKPAKGGKTQTEEA